MALAFGHYNIIVYLISGICLEEIPLHVLGERLDESPSCREYSQVHRLHNCSNKSLCCIAKEPWSIYAQLYYPMACMSE